MEAFAWELMVAFLRLPLRLAYAGDRHFAPNARGQRL